MSDGFVLSSQFQASTPRTEEVGRGFTHLAFEFGQFLDLPQNLKDEVFHCILETTKKMGKLAHSVDHYHQLEAKTKDEAIELAKRDRSSVDLMHAINSVELEGALENVVGDCKSALDIGVKIFYPLFNINLPTYGDDGEKIVRSLERQLPQDLLTKTELLRKAVSENKEWISKVVRHRTTAEHFTNLKISPVTTQRGEDGEIVVRLPNMPGGQPAREFVEITYENTFCFLQDLLILAMEARFYEGMAAIVQNGKSGKERIFAVALKAEAIKSATN